MIGSFKLFATLILSLSTFGFDFEHDSDIFRGMRLAPPDSKDSWALDPVYCLLADNSAIFDEHGILSNDFQSPRTPIVGTVETMHSTMSLEMRSQPTVDWDLARVHARLRVDKKFATKPFIVFFSVYVNSKRVAQVFPFFTRGSFDILMKTVSSLWRQYASCPNFPLRRI